MALLPSSRLLELTVETAVATGPVTELEKFFSSQIAHAAWELERVRADAHHIDAESRLLATASRATRNWNRARKQLVKLQTARVNHATRLSAFRQQVAAATPLADPARVPTPKRAGPVLDHALDLIEQGKIPVSAITAITTAQEGR